ncbi:hypothetical protein [Sphingorhabdus sp. SMR4y]|uniref:hypothetical protein n=1 Tax=Sphingorhabdus sp. SMR4y TaxID=2584094 RepID=UPI000B617E36|nr:hypothetical protein [Sphingorhabdus sp. SMR4y]ASK87271.1 hypothetical protein SPHFLASMR4Y_00485 [Sphingorhabdus sp. SMR4y]
MQERPTPRKAGKDEAADETGRENASAEARAEDSIEQIKDKARRIKDSLKAELSIDIE